MKYYCLLLTVFTILTASALHAEVAAAVLPFEGNDPAKTDFRKYVMKEISSSRQVSMVADDKLKEIIAIHEKAQATGSAVLDMTKLKSAEYLIEGSVTETSAELTVIDVNSGTKIFYKNETITDKNRNSVYYSLTRGAIDKLVMNAASKNREVPEEASAYMTALDGFVKSLPGDDSTSYRFIAVYQKGKFINPDSKDKKAVDKVKRFLKVVRPNLIRAKLSYLSMEKTANNVIIIAAAEKSGSVTKHKFVFVELENGDLALLTESYALVN